MGIRFTCQECGHRLNVKDHLAGKRGICPKCQAKLDIPPLDAAPSPTAAPHQTPLESVTEVAGPDEEPVESVPVAKVIPQMADPIAEAPNATWYAVPPGSSTKFGPAQGDLFRQWIVEGRISRDTLIWREGWADWLVAGEVLPQLQPTVLPPRAQEAAPIEPSRPAWNPGEPVTPHHATSPAGKVVALPRSKRKTVIALVILVVALIPLLFIALRR